MRATKLYLPPLLLLGFGALTVAFAQPAPYRMLTTIPIPGNLAVGVDISWVDAANGRYYVTDRGNPTATPPIGFKIDVIDTEHDQFIGAAQLPARVNGVVAIPRAHELWAGDSNSNVQVISTDTLTVTHTITTGGKMRADEIAFDPVHHLILVANDQDTPPFVSFISTTNYYVLRTINYDGVQGPQSTGGIEQPLWDGGENKFYIAIPSTKDNPNGEVDELDPSSMSVTKRITTTCGPAGLVLIPGQRLMTSCGDIIDIAGVKVLNTVLGVGGDEIWYNPGDDHVYFGGGTNRISVPVVDVNSGQLLTTLTVGQTATMPTNTTHSVAADVNNRIFVPVTNQGVQVWSNGPAPASISASPNPIPVTGGATLGQTTLTWNAPDAQVIEIHIGSPTGPLFTQQGNSGSIQTGVWVSDGLTFFLQDVTNGPAAAGNTVASVVVHLKSM